MLIYSEHITPRLKYIVRFIFDDFLGMKTEITSNKELFLQSNDTGLSYHSVRLKDEFNIQPTGLLFEDHIEEKRPDVSTWNDIKVIFPVKGESDLPFDLFSAVFFLTVRYEEYLPYKGDKYGRFSATESISFKNGFLEHAIVDRWIIAFSNILKKKYPDFIPSRRNFRFIPTVDVDNAYAYLNKGSLKCIGGAIKSILKRDFPKFKERLDVVTGKQQDPFYTFEKIEEIHQNPGLVTFFLTAAYGGYDKGMEPDSDAFKNLVNHVSFFSFIGIHPSWRSGRKPGLLEKELKTLSRIAAKSITRSRQHFLMIDFPGTYNKLSELDITEDYSMGYSSHVGFRAGTSTPFHFFDLKSEQETSLVIYPFQVMDRTLKDYMNMQPAEATQKINEMIDEVRAVNGTFISIFHNETFSDAGEWKGWLEVYKKLLESTNEK
jgi:hypothetical protein